MKILEIALGIIGVVLLAAGGFWLLNQAAQEKEMYHDDKNKPK